MATLPYRTTEKSLKIKFKKKSKYLIGNLFIVFSLFHGIKKIIQGKNTLYFTRMRKNVGNVH